MFALLVIAVWVIAANVRGTQTILNDVPSYANATRTELTAKGNAFVDGLYSSHSREASAVRAYTTHDDPATVLNFYRDALRAKGYSDDGGGGVPDAPNIIFYRFERNTNTVGSIAILFDPQDDGYITGQQGGDSAIIVLEGA